VPYEIVFKPSALREFNKLPRQAQATIGQAIDALADNPRPIGSVKLTDKKGLRIRVGSYRVVYDVRDNVLVVEVLKVADRKEVYR
jgi:mRNA interferase RelE/StbE